MSIKEQIMNASKDQLGILESKLNGLLKPIAPRREFVNTLRARIHVTNAPAIIGRFTNIQFLVMMILGVLSGVVLVSVGARFLVDRLSLNK